MGTCPTWSGVGRPTYTGLVLPRRVRVSAEVIVLASDAGPPRYAPGKANVLRSSRRAQGRKSLWIPVFWLTVVVG